MIKNITKSLLALGGFLVLWGICVRLFRFMVFWESAYLGFELLLLAGAFYLVGTARRQSRLGKSSAGAKIGIGAIAFLLLVQLILVSVIPRTDAFSAATSYIQTDAGVRQDIGEIKSTIMAPFGSMQITSSSEGQSGEAELHLLVKGTKGYRDMSIYVSKTNETPWTVLEAR